VEGLVQGCALMLLAIRLLRMKDDERSFCFVVGPIPLSYDAPESELPRRD
jgi:hypothetical protein